MVERKTEVVNLRMSPRIKELLRIAAAHERRSLSNMLEVLIEDYCKSHHLDHNLVTRHRGVVRAKESAPQ